MPRKLRLPIDMTELHVPVLAAELTDAVAPSPGDIFVDCTFGAGGHARLIADAIGPKGKLIAIDCDPRSEAEYERFVGDVECETGFLRCDFFAGLQQLAGEGVRAKGIYMDLGMSSMQVGTRERGFSYACDAPLDMRMDPDQDLSAYEVVNEWPQQRLAAIFRQYGEERFFKQIAREIVRRRQRQPLATTLELVKVIKQAVPRPAQFGAGHPARRVFQAIRIAVNDELETLDRSLPLAWELLAPGGVMAAISFHSLEDRRVKHFFADKARGCVCPPDLPVCACGHEPEGELIRRRAIMPSAGELAINPRARSARLRAARKIVPGGAN